jgi:hypothetical protein
MFLLRERLGRIDGLRSATKLSPGWTGVNSTSGVTEESFCPVNVSWAACATSSASSTTGIRIEQAYVQWIRRYILFHGKRHQASLALNT